jgi:hypothetical protein
MKKAGQAARGCCVISRPHYFSVFSRQPKNAAACSAALRVFIVFETRSCGIKMKKPRMGLLSHGRELNPQPITYEAIALPIELPWRRPRVIRGRAGLYPAVRRTGRQENRP